VSSYLTVSPFPAHTFLIIGHLKKQLTIKKYGQVVSSLLHYPLGYPSRPLGGTLPHSSPDFPPAHTFLIIGHLKKQLTIKKYGQVVTHRTFVKL